MKRRFPIVVLAAGTFLACSDTPVSFQPDETGDLVTQEQPRLVSPFMAETDGLPISTRPPPETFTEPAPAPPGANLVVDDDGIQCPTAGFTTIQAAVDAAALAVGVEKIRVCPGMYPENVLIGAGNSLKLEGDGVGVTRVTGVAGTAGPIIDVTMAGKVDIKKLTVDGGSAMAGGVVIGIRYDETDGKIKDVEVLNIRNASGTSEGIGIRVQSTTGAKTKVTVEKTLVDNYTRVGINGNGLGVDIKVQKNTVKGPVLPRVFAPNGIQISRGARAKVKDNNVDNNPSPNPPGGAGSGILLFCAGKTEVHKNTVSNADLGIALGDNADAKVHHNDIFDSVFDGISLQFIGLFFGPLGCPNDPLPSPTTGNDVFSNNIDDSGDTGISFANFDPATLTTTPNDNSVDKNSIDGSVNDGIHVFAFFFGADNPSNNELEKNEITNSGGTDAVDDTAGGGTAGTANTWKKNKCTTSSPAGLCM